MSIRDWFGGAEQQQRTDATVSPTSMWAWEWLPVDGGRTRAAEDIVGKQ